MKRNIKELLSIDLNAVLSSAKFAHDELRDRNDSRQFLNFTLTDKFLGTFETFGLITYDGEPVNIEFKTSKAVESQIRDLIALIVDEYGPDQIGLTADDYKIDKDFSWWFTNEAHDMTTDDPLDPDPVDTYYSIMISPAVFGGVELLLGQYMNLETEKNKKLATTMAISHSPT